MSDNGIDSQIKNELRNLKKIMRGKLQDLEWGKIAFKEAAREGTGGAKEDAG